MPVVQILTIEKRILANFPAPANLTNSVSSVDFSMLIKLLLAKKSLFWLGLWSQECREKYPKNYPTD